ncbi:MAG: hypothetical protein PHX87_06070 [Candidatus Peribacteraceae bacterium]|nr:hypothetical protein [Candidatus Peribacteraceae bacterium]MDD5742956.1 hypothetical protein [Candidatus Peribacteraceae bacterium]
MQSETLISRPTSALSAVRIDCSRSTDLALIDVLEWISSFPNRSDLHIVLPSLRGQPAHRQALSSLQRLGCRVTCKI